MPNSDLSELNRLVNQIKPFITRDEQLQSARRMRNEVQADWLSNFMDTMMAQEASPESNDPTINKQTGMRHTVESMVEELSSRVGLQTLSKTASEEPSDEELEQLAEYVSGRLARSGNYVGLEQLLSGIMEERKLSGLAAKLGRDGLKAYVEKLLEKVDRPDINKMLPQAAPGAPNTRSQMSTGPNDPNRYMFTSSNPSARYT